MTIFTRTAAFIYSYNLSLSVAEQKYTFFDFCMFFSFFIFLLCPFLNISFYFVSLPIFEFTVCF